MGAGPATVGSGYSPTPFPTVPFPAGAVGTSPSYPSRAVGAYTLVDFDVCAQLSNAAALQSFLTAQMPANAWATSQVFPYDTLYSAPCAGQSCWATGRAPNFVTVENAVDHNNGLVTYHMRLGSPPDAPIGQECGTPAQQTYTTTYQGAPLPPLTELFGGSMSPYTGDAAACSSIGSGSGGSASGIASFAARELPALGWTPGSAPVGNRCHTTGSGTWSKNGTYMTYDVSQWTMANPYWNISYCYP
jgi:hypothetical protein